MYLPDLEIILRRKTIFPMLLTFILRRLNGDGAISVVYKYQALAKVWRIIAHADIP